MLSLICGKVSHKFPYFLGYIQGIKTGYELFVEGKESSTNQDIFSFTQNGLNYWIGLHTCAGFTVLSIFQTNIILLCNFKPVYFGLFQMFC